MSIRIASRLDREGYRASIIKDKIEEYEKTQSTGLPVRKGLVGTDEACEYDQLLASIKARRSVRFYEAKNVTRDTVEKVVNVINWSPNSCNKQTAKVFVASNPSLVESCLLTCKGATGFSEFIPIFLCFCSDLRSYILPAEMLLPSIDVSLGVQNCCLVAHSLGLSITLLSWAQHTKQDDRRLRSLLGIPDYYQIIVNGTMGYPEYILETPGRKALESTFVLR